MQTTKFEELASFIVNAECF